jgi:hypothetical protein
MDPYLLQWRLYNYNIRIEYLWPKNIMSMLTSIDTLLKRPQIQIMYIMIVCRGVTVGDRGSMPWMPAYTLFQNRIENSMINH